MHVAEKREQIEDLVRLLRKIVELLGCVSLLVTMRYPLPCRVRRVARFYDHATTCESASLIEGPMVLRKFEQLAQRVGKWNHLRLGRTHVQCCA